MEKIQSFKIQDREYETTYTAIIQENGDGWIGWIEEHPKVKCQDTTIDGLLKSLEHTLYKTLEADWKAWDKQLEEDIKAGKLDKISVKVKEMNMEQKHSAKILDQDGVDEYNVHIQKNGDVWIGQIQEYPEITCEENTKIGLLKTLEEKLHSVLEAKAEAWDKQIEEDIKAGKLDHLGEKAIEDYRKGRCTDL